VVDNGRSNGQTSTVTYGLPVVVRAANQTIVTTVRSITSGYRCRKGTANTLAALKSIRAARRHGAPIYIILDNLSAHTGADIRRWARQDKVELCFTPTYASWANPIEAHFGPLRQFTWPTPTISTTPSVLWLMVGAVIFLSASYTLVRDARRLRTGPTD
jgi:transposase InsO family protein